MKYKKFSKSSKIWLKRNSINKNVLISKEKKLVSRSWFKIHEINLKSNIFKNNMNIIDLGSSPGGWSKYASKYIKNKGNIISCDINNMKFTNNIIFYKGNLLNKKFLKLFLKKISIYNIDVLMSDMSPNISGNKCVDNCNIINLLNLSFKICKKIFLKNGIYIVKAFEGTYLNKYIKILKDFFINVKIYKLKSSYNSSRELFIVGKGTIR
ncbi:RlmE family RNA methyltransferase [Buchnera aphidicola (Ceratovacuna keduensis)]|uniref:RlmE family RNA methyltransferase n=1 Tax=Buchnera aphidicola TaxID=9 RepID=UPI0031B7F8A8